MKEELIEAIIDDRIVYIETINGKSRIIPLIVGELKDGTVGVSCYKIVGENLVQRTYYVSKIVSVESSFRYYIKEPVPEMLKKEYIKVYAIKQHIYS